MMGCAIAVSEIAPAALSGGMREIPARSARARCHPATGPLRGGGERTTLKITWTFFPFEFFRAYAVRYGTIL